MTDNKGQIRVAGYSKEHFVMLYVMSRAKANAGGLKGENAVQQAIEAWRRMIAEDLFYVTK